MEDFTEEEFEQFLKDFVRFLGLSKSEQDEEIKKIINNLSDVIENVTPEEREEWYRQIPDKSFDSFILGNQPKTFEDIMVKPLPSILREMRYTGHIDWDDEMFNDIPKPTQEDIDILKSNTRMTLKNGCKDCGSKTIIFQAAISVEEENKVFILMIECTNCNSKYTEILDIVPHGKPQGRKRDEFDDRSLYK